MLVLQNAPREAVRLRTTNGLFVQQGLKLEPAFAELAEDQFAAPVEPVDFLGDPEQARQTVNARVAEQTEERIREILPARSVDSGTRLVLSSAVYFLGPWAFPFMKEATAPMDFYVDGRTPRKVSMMHQRKALHYGEVDDVLLLALPYEGWEISMLLILPTERAGLGKVEESLTPERLESYMGRLTHRPVEVSLPRFEVESSLELGATLRDLGMRLAFNDSRADFSGITRTERLSISEAYHQVFVKVDEAGTEAAAATALTMSSKSARGASEFVADHPFLFVIRDTSSGALLFLGRVVAPAS